ncbi:hypothetical protein RE6C_03198 [Rhodopirellula europaea 6C]|uniref:Uncharacterized protein n=1 Tax=Rhodopirellula europaea 6C TaxID=1263867 RepID=M2ATP4_9BACT|nr:hypothetical protein RE6C_03198 [Rhodopirellula europaea 6C]
MLGHHSNDDLVIGSASSRKSSECLPQLLLLGRGASWVKQRWRCDMMVMRFARLVDTFSQCGS